MNKKELAKILEQHKIRRDAYDLEGVGDPERYVLRFESSGEWSVFYSERGLKTEMRRFATESEACEHLLHLLLSDRSAFYSGDGQ